MRRSIAPWWVFPCAAAFLGYFALLVYCDIRRPVPEGMELASTRSRPGLAVNEVTARVAGRRAPASASVTWSSRPIDAPVNSKSEWEAVQANVAFGRAVALEVERDGVTFGAEWLVTPAGLDYWLHREGIDLLVTRLVQFITLLLGLVVVFRRPFDPGARLGGWLLATFGVFCIALPYRIADVWGGLPLWAGAVLWLPLASTLAMPALLLSFFLSFPRRALRSPAAGSAIWTPAALMSAPPPIPRQRRLPARGRTPPGRLVRLALGRVDRLSRRRRDRRVRQVPSRRSGRAPPPRRAAARRRHRCGGRRADCAGVLARVRNDAVRLASPRAGHARPSGGSAVVRLRHASPPGVRRQLHHPAGRPVRPRSPPAAVGRAGPSRRDGGRRLLAPRPVDRRAVRRARAGLRRPRRARPRRGAADAVAGSTRSTGGSSASATTRGRCCTAWSKRSGDREASNWRLRWSWSRSSARCTRVS